MDQHIDVCCANYYTSMSNVFSVDILSCQKKLNFLTDTMKYNGGSVDSEAGNLITN